MLRTELIPQTSAAINKGKVFYHFSMQHTATNAPSPKGEHQINFFESHFTEMKYGQEGGSDNHLHWYVGGKSQWDAELVAGDWHNVAYGIDFSAGTVVPPAEERPRPPGTLDEHLDALRLLAEDRGPAGWHP